MTTPDSTTDSLRTPDLETLRGLRLRTRIEEVEDDDTSRHQEHPASLRTSRDQGTFPLPDGITQQQEDRQEQQNEDVVPELQPRQSGAYSISASSLTDRTGVVGERNSATTGTSSSPQPDTDKGDFDCNICFDTVTDPVVTCCGHLYCWTCLAQALSRSRNVCPVCKSGCDPQKDVIPIYGRGKKQVDPRKVKPLEDIIKEFGPRPAGQQTAAPNPPRMQDAFFSPWGLFGGAPPGPGPGFAISAGLFPFFPGFGVTMNMGPRGPIRNDLTPQQQQQQQFLSRMFFFVGIFILLVLLFPAPY